MAKKRVKIGNRHDAKGHTVSTKRAFQGPLEDQGLQDGRKEASRFKEDVHRLESAVTNNSKSVDGRPRRRSLPRQSQAARKRRSSKRMANARTESNLHKTAINRIARRGCGSAWLVSEDE